MTIKKYRKALKSIDSKEMASKLRLLTQEFLTKFFQFIQFMLYHADRFINFVTKPTDSDRDDVLQAARPPVLFGIYVILVFVVFGGLWSAVAPLNSAAIAVGTVVANSNKKVIQHQEGGIIKDIFVKQGENVHAGDKLVELDDTRIKSKYASTLHQYRLELASESRLTAERDGLEEIDFPEELKECQDLPEVHKIINTQENLFKYKKDMVKAEKDGLKQRIAQAHKEIEILTARRIAYQKSYEVTQERVKALRSLHSRGFAQRNMLLDAESKEANALGELSSTDAGIVKLEQEITRFQIEMLNIQNKSTSDTLRELREAQLKTSAYREELISLKDSLNRSIIRSPVDGVVNAVRYHTVGGVISPGAEILEVSPINDSLIIEAKVPNRNIDAVHVGLVAKIRFSAFKSRTTPLFTGKVVAVSPDIVQPDRSQQGGPQEPYYVARIEIDMDEFNKIAKAKKLELHPGMQAEIQIVTGTRTLLQYLLDPIRDTMFKAFNEK